MTKLPNSLDIFPSLETLKKPTDVVQKVRQVHSKSRCVHPDKKLLNQIKAFFAKFT